MMVTTRFMCMVVAFGLLAIAIDATVVSAVFLMGVAITFGPRSMIVDMHAPRVESQDAG